MPTLLPAQAHPPAALCAREPGGLRPAAIALFLAAAFIAAAAAVAFRKDVREGFDEVAHLSYVADLQRMPTAWPRLTDLRLLDPDTFRFTPEASYINHPPPYYWALARLGPPVAENAAALPIHRLMNVALAALGFAVLALLVNAAGLARLETLALIAPLVMVPVLPAIAGAVNNDNAAFAAGVLALLGLHGLIATGRARWLAPALAGLVLAGAAKLNALLLVGGFCGAGFAFLAWRGRFRFAWALPVGLAVLLAAAPYVVFVLQYGSPAPHTAGQQAMLETIARELGWADAPRLPLPRYVAFFIAALLERWSPALQAGPFAAAALLVPLSALACAAGGLCVALARLRFRREGALDAIVIAGWIAIAATFALHVGFSYSRHLATGWLLDTYPRYYIALFAIVPLSGLVLLSALPEGRGRRALAGFLVLAPLALGLATPLMR